ncbi:MAG: ribosomal protein S18-alanine N-acetyltransferase [Acidobacteria bacterium]|nr:ribosomal protein S18-alanine N-acetyltransferase [Acidobacteriota bacterium]
MPAFHVRRLDEADIPTLLLIQQSSREAAQWTTRQYASTVADDSSAGGLVIEADDSVIGFLTYLSAVAADTEVTNLAVDPAHRRLGAAKLLLSALRQKVAGDIFLEVRAANEAAQALYRHAGFVAVGSRKNYYDNPPDDAVIMKSICPSQAPVGPAEVK